MFESKPDRKLVLLNKTIMENLNNINQRILDNARKLDSHYDENWSDTFDEREGYIVANIKTYSWLDENDVEEIAKKLDIQNIAPIMDEFDENRLTSIWNHCAEWEVECFKENEFDNASHNVEHWKKNPPKDKESEFWCKYNKAIVDLQLDSEDVWQFGRSGGWLSFMGDSQVTESKYSDAEYFIDDFLYDINCVDGELNDKVFNEIFEESFQNCYSKYDIENDKELRTAKNYKFAVNRIIENRLQEISDTYDNIQTVIDGIERQVDGFKDVLLNQLENEISDFLNENEELQKIDKLTEKQIEWIDHKTDFYNGYLSLVRKDGDMLKTSKGVSVPVKDVQALMAIIKPELSDKEIKVDKGISNYRVEYIRPIENDYLIKAGCHYMLMSNFNRIGL